MSSQVANVATLFDHYCIQSWTDPLTNLATPYAKEFAPDGVMEKTTLGRITFLVLSVFKYPANFLLNAPEKLKMPVYLAPIEYTFTSGILAARRLYDVIGHSKTLREKIDSIGEKAKTLASTHFQSDRNEDFETLQGTLKEQTIEILNEQTKGQSELKWNQLLGILSYEGLNTLGAASRAYVPYLVTSHYTDSLTVKILVSFTCYWGLSYALNPAKREELSTLNHSNAITPPAKEVGPEREIVGNLVGRTLLPYLLTSYYTDSTILAVAVPIISSAYMSYTLYSSENEKPLNHKSSQKTEILTYDTLSKIKIKAEALFRNSTNEQNKQFIENLRSFELTYQSHGTSTARHDSFSSDMGKEAKEEIRSILKKRDHQSRSKGTNPPSLSNDRKRPDGWDALLDSYNKSKTEAEKYPKSNWKHHYHMYEAYKYKMNAFELYKDGSKIKEIYTAKKSMIFYHLNSAFEKHDNSYNDLLTDTLSDLKIDLGSFAPNNPEHKYCNKLIEIIEDKYSSE